MGTYKVGDQVKWKWGNNYAYGRVKSLFAEKTTRKIKGNEVTKHGTKDNPAVFIEQEDGDHVLKLSSELYKS